MTDPRAEAEARRIRNLQAVASHLAAGGAEEATPARVTDADPPADGSGSREDAAQRRRRWARWGPIGLAIAFVLGKLKLVLPLVKFAQLGTLLTMVVSVWAYALLWGFPFAAGFVLLIFFHELGHAIVMRRQGIPAGAPVFIPFVGAVIAMKGLPRDAYVEALVGIGGPVLGSLAAFVCLAVGWATGEPFWYALASTGFLINLFNLLPVSPLDGGRIVGVISRWFWAVGYALGIWIFLQTRHPLLFLILLIGLLGLTRAIRGPSPEYYDVAPARRLGMGIAYFGLAGLLALAMWATDQRLDALS
jgi:Zn-dependent protease